MLSFSSIWTVCPLPGTDRCVHYLVLTGLSMSQSNLHSQWLHGLSMQGLIHRIYHIVTKGGSLASFEIILPLYPGSCFESRRCNIEWLYPHVWYTQTADLDLLQRILVSLIPIRSDALRLQPRTESVWSRWSNTHQSLHFVWHVTLCCTPLSLVCYRVSCITMSLCGVWVPEVFRALATICQNFISGTFRYYHVWHSTVYGVSPYVAQY